MLGADLQLLLPHLLLLDPQHGLLSLFLLLRPNQLQLGPSKCRCHIVRIHSQSSLLFRLVSVGGAFPPAFQRRSLPPIRCAALGERIRIEWNNVCSVVGLPFVAIA